MKTIFLEKHKIGIIVGGGSGKILTEVFINFLKQAEEIFNLDFKFYVNSICPTKIKNTNGKLKFRLPEELDYPQFSTSSSHNDNSEEEVTELIELLNAWDKEGIKYIFRTSINADILYKLREKVEGIKIIESNFNNNKLIIVRDEIQGFYANDFWTHTTDKIEAKLHFSKENFKKLIYFSERIAKEIFNDSKPEILAIYKHHLFNGYIEKWINQYAKEKNLKIKTLQPDTGSSKIINSIISEQNKNYLIIAGNEYGDVIHEDILNIEGKLKYKIALFTKNYYLNYSNYEVIQTVHGSADDKNGQVLPIATIRIAAYILSQIIKNPKISTKIINDVDKLSKQILIKYLKDNNGLEYQNYDTLNISSKFINLINQNYGKKYFNSKTGI